LSKLRASLQASLLHFGSQLQHLALLQPEMALLKGTNRQAHTHQNRKQLHCIFAEVGVTNHVSQPCPFALVDFLLFAEGNS